MFHADNTMTNRTMCPIFSYLLSDFACFGHDFVESLGHSDVHSINRATNTTTYPELVQEFWGGVEYDEQRGFEGWVQDTFIKIDMHTISQRLEQSN